MHIYINRQSTHNIPHTCAPNQSELFVVIIKSNNNKSILKDEIYYCILQKNGQKK